MDFSDDFGIPKDPVFEEVMKDPLESAGVTQEPRPGIHEDPLCQMLDACEASIEGTYASPGVAGETSALAGPGSDSAAALSVINATMARRNVVAGLRSPDPAPPPDFSTNEPMHSLKPPWIPKRVPFGRASISGRRGLGLGNIFSSGLFKKIPFPWRGFRTSGQGIRYCPEKGLIPRSDCYNCERYDPDSEHEGENCSLLREDSDSSEE